MSLTTGKWVNGLAHWRDQGERVAFLSIAFTWKINEARELARYYKAIGYHVKAGGPAMFRMAWAMLSSGTTRSPPQQAGDVRLKAAQRA